MQLQKKHDRPEQIVDLTNDTQNWRYVVVHKHEQLHKSLDQHEQLNKSTNKRLNGLIDLLFFYFEIHMSKKKTLISFFLLSFLYLHLFFQ